MSLLISYSRRDAAAARRLHAAPEARSCEFRVDRESVWPSADWMRETEAAIDAADGLIFVISPATASRFGCNSAVTMSANP